MCYKKELNPRFYDGMKQAKVIFNYPNFKFPVAAMASPFSFLFFPSGLSQSVNP
jgi:hypothetical protein